MYPCFLKDEAVILTDEHLVIGGEAIAWPYPEGVTAEFLERVCMLADGTGTWPAIAAALGRPSRAIGVLALNFLRLRGLLEHRELQKDDASGAASATSNELSGAMRTFRESQDSHQPGRQPLPGLSPHAEPAATPDQTFLRRLLVRHGAARPCSVFQDRLQQTGLHVLAPPDLLPAAALLAESLHTSGFPYAHIRVSSSVGACLPAPAQHPATNTLLVVLCHHEDSASSARGSLAQGKQQQGYPWLRLCLATADGSAEIGPYIFPPDLRPTCFLPGIDPEISPHANLAAAVPEVKPSAPGSYGPLSSFDRAVLSMAAVEILAYAFGTSELALRGRIRSIRPTDFTSHERAAQPPLGAPADLPLRTEAVAALEADLYRTHRNPLKLPAPASPRRRALVTPSTRTKQYLFNYSVALPREPADPLLMSRDSETFALSEFEAERSSQTIALTDLAAILHATAGHRSSAPDAPPRRSNATAGNLGSVELFLIARQVDHLDPACYFYDASAHRLSRMETRETQAHALLHGLEAILPPELSACPAILVFTGALWRLQPKYGVFAWKLLHLDAGVALSQAQLLAAARNLQTIHPSRWLSRSLSRALGLRTPDEQITCLIGLGAANTCVYAPAHTSPVTRPVGVEDSSPSLTPEDAPLNEQDHILRCLSEERDQVRLSAARAPSTYRQEPFSTAPVSLLARRLPFLLTYRESLRTFARRPISRKLISQALQAAAEMLAPTEQGVQDAPLQLLLLARDVEGVAPGAYILNLGPDQQAWLPAFLLPPTDDLEQVFVQPEIAQAPAIFFVVAHFPTHTPLDAHVYSSFLIGAGLLANTLWLAAIDQGLTGTVIAGLVPGAATRVLHLPAHGTQALLALPLGHGRPHGLLEQRLGSRYDP